MSDQLMKNLFMFGTAVILFILASNMSYQDAVDSHNLYCVQVFGYNPIYPDYNNLGIDACRRALK